MSPPPATLNNDEFCIFSIFDSCFCEQGSLQTWKLRTPHDMVYAMVNWVGQWCGRLGRVGNSTTNYFFLYAWVLFILGEYFWFSLALVLVCCWPHTLGLPLPNSWVGEKPQPVGKSACTAKPFALWENGNRNIQPKLQKHHAKMLTF